mmetsp:Transcript_29648/g.95773  ORF Transcript_29648/g.95773 Transcript_29648/m.95773 type:complete len:276 (-) Transcript_29648:727-1554(-)|eukprot:scaffold9095_cov125-Isochrysis_galbana.AAC.6
MVQLGEAVREQHARDHLVVWHLAVDALHHRLRLRQQSHQRIALWQRAAWPPRPAGRKWLVALLCGLQRRRRQHDGVCQRHQHGLLGQPDAQLALQRPHNVLGLGALRGHQHLLDLLLFARHHVLARRPCQLEERGEHRTHHQRLGLAERDLLAPGAGCDGAQVALLLQLRFDRVDALAARLGYRLHHDGVPHPQLQPLIRRGDLVGRDTDGGVQLRGGGGDDRPEAVCHQLRDEQPLRLGLDLAKYGRQVGKRDVAALGPSRRRRGIVRLVRLEI